MIVAAAVLALAVVVVAFGAARWGRGNGRSRAAQDETSTPPAAASEVTTDEEALTRHRHQALEVLSRRADGQPLCRIEPGASGHLKHDEGVVAALADVARRHRAHPGRRVRASAAHVLQAWTTEADKRDGPALAGLPGGRGAGDPGLGRGHRVAVGRHAKPPPLLADQGQACSACPERVNFRAPYEHHGVDIVLAGSD